MCELRHYKLYVLIEGREIEYGDWNRLAKVKEVEDRLRAKGYNTFVEEITEYKERV